MRARPRWRCWRIVWLALLFPSAAVLRGLLGMYGRRQLPIALHIAPGRSPESGAKDVGTPYAGLAPWSSLCSSIFPLPADITESWSSSRKPASFTNAAQGLDLKGKTASAVFTHIPKTAGASAFQDFQRLGFNLDVDNHWKGEHCANEKSGAHHLLFVREPRAHVLSQFLECAYVKFDSVQSGPEGVARAFNITKDEPWTEKFTLWLQHFVNEHEAPDPGAFNKSCVVLRSRVQCHLDYGCYNPWNHQARVLACKSPMVHLSHFLITGHPLYAVKEPAVGPPVAKLRRAGFVGITELYHESICLLQWRVNGTLPFDCGCTAEAVAATGPRNHVTHGVPQHSVDDISPNSLVMVDAITAADRIIYMQALRRVLCELRALEDASGVKVFCEAKLAKLRGATRYIEGLWV
mmetsp:Transcript_102614/g.289974  ORF Transcript_102614/g.289974 Transcript_102614/m.289974 type:complete len:407 (-) Transcript_102614:38-1258(-)